MSKNEKERPSTSTEQGERGNCAAAILRLKKDINELTIPATCKVEFPDPDNPLFLNVVITPDKGYYKNGKFWFTISIGDDYPIEPPKVKCMTPVFHPNIDLDGNIYLNILKEDWSPVLNINSVILGLLFLFMEPSVADPLNQEAADLLKNDPQLFQSKVIRTMNKENIEQLEQFFSRVRNIMVNRQPPPERRTHFSE